MLFLDSFGNTFAVDREDLPGFTPQTVEGTPFAASAPSVGPAAEIPSPAPQNAEPGLLRQYGGVLVLCALAALLAGIWAYRLRRS